MAVASHSDASAKQSGGRERNKAPPESCRAFFPQSNPISVRNRPNSWTAPTTGSSDVPARGALMAAAAPHPPPTNHRASAGPRDFCLGSDGADIAYFRLGSYGGCPPSAPPARLPAVTWPCAGAAPGSSGRRRVPPLGRAGGTEEEESGGPASPASRWGGEGGRWRWRGSLLWRRAYPSPRCPGPGEGHWGVGEVGSTEGPGGPWGPGEEGSTEGSGGPWGDRGGGGVSQAMGQHQAWGRLCLRGRVAMRRQRAEGGGVYRDPWGAPGWWGVWLGARCRRKPKAQLCPEGSSSWGDSEGKGPGREPGLRVLSGVLPPSPHKAGGAGCGWGGGQSRGWGRGQPGSGLVGAALGEKGRCCCRISIICGSSSLLPVFGVIKHP